MPDRPLAGVRVVALEQAVAMPYCSFVLAEMGAEVVKIERPGRGDVIREWDQAVRGLSTGYVWLNANKRDVTVDVRRPPGQEIVRRLVARADVFLENFAPGVVARLRLSDAELRPLNERLIYCSLSGYGQNGPYQGVKAYDLLIQGESGILMTTGYPDTPAKVGIPLADLIGGANAALGVVLALYERDRTGRGRYLDVALFESVLAWLAYYPQYVWHTGEEPPRSGMRHQYLCPYGPYRARDGRFVNLAVASEDHWRRFCSDVVAQPGWIGDPRFATMEARRRHRAELEASVEQVIASEELETWLARLAAAGLPHGRVRGIAEVLDHPQTDARHLVVEASSEVGRLPLLRFPLAPADVERHVPGLGEHTDEVLVELGYRHEEIEDLRAQGVI